MDFQLVYRKGLKAPWVVLLNRPETGKQICFASAPDTTTACGRMLGRLKKRFPDATWRDADVADWGREEAAA
jgi:hypothetical protein